MSGPVDEVSRNVDPVTMTRFLLAERMRFKEASGNFALLLQSVQLACKVISNAVRKAGIANLFGMAGGTNTTGDDQKKLDVIANEIMINALRFSEQVYVLGSEENDKAIIVERADGQSGGYAVVFDPLDGSSNIDCNLSVGTIFGIYKKDPFHTGKGSVQDLLRPGVELIASGYALYDSATMIVLTTGLGVNGFTLDPSLGEFVLTHPNIKIPKKGKIYSVNEGNSEKWDAPTTAFVKSCKAKGKSCRYVGSMVGDVHRTLLYGGVFMYPPDKKAPNGKLRLLYECNPMSMIIEQAGGKASTGRGRIMELKPTALHQRCPVFIGSADDVSEVEQLYKTEGNTPAKL